MNESTFLVFEGKRDQPVLFKYVFPSPPTGFYANVHNLSDTENGGGDKRPAAAAEESDSEDDMLGRALQIWHHCSVVKGSVGFCC